MISVVEKAEHFYGQRIIFFFKVDDVKSSSGLSLIKFPGLYPKLSVFFPPHEMSLTMFLPPVFLMLGVIQR